MRSVELFSGCGGLALGLARAGFHHDLLVEYDDDAVSTLRLNGQRGVDHVRDWTIDHGDVRLVDWSRLHGEIALVAGGPPCQPFSVGGKHRGHEDERDMWPQAVRAVHEIWPKAFLFENVRGLARPAFADYLHWIKTALRYPHIERRRGESHGDHLARIQRSKSRASYDLGFFKINAADFGAPQKRHRVIFVGIRRDIDIRITAPATTHSRERLLWDQWVTGEYWERHGMRPRGKGPATGADIACVSRLKTRLVAPEGLPWVTVRDAIADLGDPDGVANHVFQPKAKPYPGHTGSALDQPAKALKAGDHGVPGGENMMIRDSGRVRYFTTREAARLQGLPDDFLFECSWTEAMRQIGNAVPAHVSEYFGHWLRQLLDAAETEEHAAA